jgi:hypothetical protein
MRNRALLDFSVLVLLAGCNSHAYYEEAQSYVSEAQQVLVDAQWCQKRAPCSENDLVKFEAGGWQLGPLNYGGVYINVYQVDDSSVGERIIARFREKHKSMPGVAVHVRIYATKHNEPKRLTSEAKIG